MSGDATSLALAIRKRQVTAAGVMRASLTAARHTAALGAISSLDVSLAHRLADEFDARAAEDPARVAPFGGVPTLAKDLGGPFAGLPVRAGSRALPALEGDSDLAARFRAAGLLPFGLTTSPEFGLSLASEPAVGPISRNPLHHRLSSGGSSGGAAAAVASGVVAIAHATDAGGSIRVPAAACGLIGLKPGRGTMPGGPGYGNHLAGIASEFAVCRSTRDAGRLFDALHGQAHGPYAEPHLAPPPTGRLSIGLLTETGPDWPTSPARATAIEDAAKALESQGHLIRPVAWSDIAELAQAANRLFAGIIAINLAHLAELPVFDLQAAEPVTRATIAMGQALSGTEVWAMLAGMPALSHRLAQLFDRMDLLLTPMLATAPRPLGSFPSDHSDAAAHFNRMARFAPLAALANIAGNPAISLPFGADDEGLPLPVQILGPMGSERVLLAIAARLESEGRWRHPHPVAGLPA